MRDLDHSNKMVKVFALGGVNRKLQMFTKQENLSKTDELLLKGFYTNVT